MENTPSASPQEPITTTYFLRPWRSMVLQRGWPTLRYLMHTEAHTFAFSVAANAILSFFPFLVLMAWLIRGVLHSQLMFDTMMDLLRDHLPAGQELVVRNLSSHGKHVKIASAVLLLITSSGVFLPLEVAFNRIWGFARNRSYLGNQLVSFGLAFGCGLLALLSTAFAAGNKYILGYILVNSRNVVFQTAVFIMLKMFAIVASACIFFFVYWILPNGKVSPRQVLPAAVAMGVLWQLARYLYVLALPWLNFKEVYGPFVTSVTLMFWAFLSGLMVLAGANLAAVGPEPIKTSAEPKPDIKPAVVLPAVVPENTTPVS
ncbi:MAG TPA: YihY/virulence factor BrkB family protein [Verrucomicrobiae bacterium]|nr:YihY/virulence factor BrkB family protein [Verrucomicrobiae bacterium]